MDKFFEKNSLYKKVERIVDLLIIPCVGVLSIIIIIEIGFPDYSEHHHTLISIIDYLIIGVFVCDLIFKYNQTKNWSKFLKLYWLDIIAVFPFFLMFKAFQGISTFFEVGETGQKILHEGIEVTKITKLNEATRVARFSRFARFARPISTLPRLLKLIPHVKRKKSKLNDEIQEIVKKESTSKKAKKINK
jgi:hypothetical protein